MYPPLDVLKPVAKDVWIVDSGPLRFAGLSLPIRMTVVRLEPGQVWLHSPTPPTPELIREIGQLGPVTHIVAPSTGHWMMVRKWQQAFPAARAWAAPGLAARKQVRQSGTVFARELGASAPPEWADDFEQVIVPGGFGYREAVFFHRASATAILTDLVVNLEADRLTPLTRVAAWATGALAPRGRAAIYLRQVMKLRRKDASAALQRIIDLSPERVIFAHGSWYEENGAERLRAALSWLL